MPVKKSAKKEVRKTSKRNLHNRAMLIAVRKIVKKVRTIESKAEAQESYKTAVKMLDHAATKGIIHKNKADRLKSRLAKFIQKLPEAKEQQPAKA